MTTPTWGAGNGANTTGDTGGTVKQAADTARSEGTEVAHTAVEAGGQVASTAADATKEVAGEARRQAKDLFGEARTQLQQQAGATQRQAAGGVRSVADELRQMAGAGDGGPVADLAHQAAGRADELAGWLEQREPGDLVEHVRRLARRRPGAFLAGAALAGVLAGRLTRGVVDHERSSSDHTADRYPPAQPGHPVPPGPVTPTPSTPATTLPPAPTDPYAPPTYSDTDPARTGGPPPGPGFGGPAGPGFGGPAGPGGPPPVTDPVPGPRTDPVPPVPPPGSGPAHALRPGSPTVGDYVDEIGRRGDPRVTEDPR